MKIPEQDFDSQEEYHFYHWLMEAEKKELVSDILYQPYKLELSPRFSVEYKKQLKTKTKICDKFLFHPHSYTPDFCFNPFYGWLDQYFINTAYLGKITVWVDVKGTFNRFGDSKQFSINQKWVYDKYEIYIEKIVPEKLFKETWVPEIARLSPKRKQPVKKYIGCKTIDEFIKLGLANNKELF